jgi:heme/copper-type cytochrome/quinol oxidase subunit 3
MTTPGPVVFERDEVMEGRTLLLGTRLFLCANTMVMLAMLFTYLYLRSQNFGGMWRPDGINDLASIAMAIILVLQLGALVALWMARSAAERGSAWRTTGVAALVLALVAGGLRVWYQYNLGDGWTINNGTYTATSEMWLGIFIVEALLGCVWLLSIVLPGARAHDEVAAVRHLRAFSEFWLYLLVASTVVWLLIRLV